jgi:hypothetical protein
MRNVASKEPLKKLAQTFENLDWDKRIAAAKWLEGVIVSQVLTAEERESIINASNEYTEILIEEEFVDKVNALIEYLRKVQKSSRERSKTEPGKCPAEYAPRKKPL